MGSFGGAVSSLLETYARCLDLLKQSTARRTKPGSPPSPVSELRSALRRARDEVRRVYSSKLSRAGSSFADGDATSTSAVRRLVRTLTAALSGLGRPATDKAPQELDGAALLSLCNSSRTEAVRTMVDLSARLSAHGGGSRGDARRHGAPPASSRVPVRPSKSRDGKKTTPRGRDDQRRPVRRGAGTTSEPRRKRLSKSTTSSDDSTKIGEIRAHGGHGRGRSLARPAVAYPPKVRDRDGPPRGTGRAAGPAVLTGRRRGS